jgi:hypothetical protein
MKRVTGAVVVTGLLVAATLVWLNVRSDRAQHATMCRSLPRPTELHAIPGDTFIEVAKQMHVTIEDPEPSSETAAEEVATAPRARKYLADRDVTTYAVCAITFSRDGRVLNQSVIHSRDRVPALLVVGDSPYWAGPCRGGTFCPEEEPTGTKHCAFVLDGKTYGLLEMSTCWGFSPSA